MIQSHITSLNECLIIIMSIIEEWDMILIESKIQLIGNYEDKIKELMNGYVGVTITRAKYVDTKIRNC